ncbi:MAG: VOC family protein, partial [Ginsengibacter sp.]
MKKPILIAMALVATFCLGFAFKSILITKETSKMKKVTGIGGIFFKCKDPKKMNEWYKTHLGIKTNE